MWGGVIDGGGCSCGAGMDVWGTDASMGQGWICGAGMHLWGRDGSIGQGCICGAGKHLWGRNLWGRDASVGQGWICGAGIYGVGLYVGQGWICEARMHLWGRNPSVGQESICGAGIYGAGMDLWGRVAALTPRPTQLPFLPMPLPPFSRPIWELLPPFPCTFALNSTHFLHFRP